MSEFKEPAAAAPEEEKSPTNGSKIVELNDSSDEESFKSFEKNEYLEQKTENIDKAKDEFETALKDEVNKGYQNVTKSEEYKAKGNEMFTAQEYIEALDFYNQAIYYCPDDEKQKLAIYYHNKGMALTKLDRKEDAIEAFTKSIQNNEDYIKPRYQRMKLYKEEEKYTEAREDAKLVLDKDPHFGTIQYDYAELEKLEKEKLEKMKNEVLGNLKNLGNMVLGKFGMNLDNFKFNQNPDGTYNISMNH